MRKHFLGIMACAFLTACSTKDNSNPINNILKYKDIELSNNIIQKEYLGDFSTIKVGTSINAEVVKSDEEKVIIYAPKEIIDKVLVENTDGNLSIRIKPQINLYSTRYINAKIFAKDFKAITANSSADIVVRPTFTQNQLSISVSSSGSIKGDFEANDLHIQTSSSGDYSGNIWALNLIADASSSGDITLKGQSKNGILKTSSSADIKAKELTVENAEAKASSSGSIEVSVSKRLVADANSSGEIIAYKKGEISVEKTQSSSGRVSVR